MSGQTPLSDWIRRVRENFVPSGYGVTNGRKIMAERIGSNARTWESWEGGYTRPEAYYLELLWRLSRDMELTPPWEVVIAWAHLESVDAASKRRRFD